MVRRLMLGYLDEFISEPPDIRNWFSSYAYQSPALDSNEDFCISPIRVDVGECGNEELFVEDSEDDKVENYVNLTKIRRGPQSGIRLTRNGCNSTFPKSIKEAKKVEGVPDADIPADPDSLSHPSEPPDIANWFSSYAYESPELDSADFDFSLSVQHTFNNYEKTEKENEELYNKLTAKANVESLSCGEIITDDSEMNVRSTGIKNNKRYSAAPKHISEGNTYSFENNSCSKITSLDDCSFKLDESVQSQRTPTKIPTPLIQEMQEHIRCGYTTQNVSQVSDQSGWIQLNRKSREAFCKNSKQDVKQCKRTKNGVSSSMKKTIPRINTENNFQKKADMNKDSAGLLGDKQTGAVAREVFKETTNTQYNYVQEPSEKWRCPQKSKPYIGPPLKQLRLERWVHRQI